MRKQSITNRTFLLILVVCISPTTYANLIDATYGLGAGSFELGGYVDNGGILPSAPGWMGIAAGDSSTITGWAVGGPGDGVDWLIAPRFGADTGVHSIDLQHQTNSSISTAIPTTPGGQYVVSFAAAAGTEIFPLFGREGQLSAGSVLDQSFSVAPSPDVSSPTYYPFSFAFTALDPATIVTFTGTGLTGNGTQYFGPMLDSVSVSAIPIPPTLLLFSSTIIGFGLLKEWRRCQR